MQIDSLIPQNNLLHEVDTNKQDHEHSELTDLATAALEVIVSRIEDSEDIDMGTRKVEVPAAKSEDNLDEVEVEEEEVEEEEEV